MKIKGMVKEKKIIIKGAKAAHTSHTQKDVIVNALERRI